MNNVRLVTEYLRERTEAPGSVLNLIKTVDGETFRKVGEDYWRVYDFVEDSVVLQTPRNAQDFYESAIAFGDFQTKLADFPVEKLVETIPNFHNTVDRYRIFKEVLRKDPCGRAKDVKAEIEFALSKEEEMSTLQRMRESGELPTRVTHNDTKLNNVLLDSATRQGLCVLDLDTVMPGLSLYDFGDAIRFGASIGGENSREPKLDLHLFRVYTEGFLAAATNLTEKEVEMLPLSTFAITLELATRFLKDYLDGDHYFKISYPEENLHRAHSQIALAADMLAKQADMTKIVSEIRCNF
jgi:Ser/Thr protein kinase RdoA (MazF antagonist)